MCFPRRAQSSAFDPFLLSVVLIGWKEEGKSQERNNHVESQVSKLFVYQYESFLSKVSGVHGKERTETYRSPSPKSRLSSLLIRKAENCQRQVLRKRNAVNTWRGSSPFPHRRRLTVELETFPSPSSIQL